MTKRIGNVVIIEDEPDKTCARCKRVADCRPVGPNGEQLCFKCATPDELKAYGERLFGPDLKSGQRPIRRRN